MELGTIFGSENLLIYVNPNNNLKSSSWTIFWTQKNN